MKKKTKLIICVFIFLVLVAAISNHYVRAYIYALSHSYEYSGSENATWIDMGGAGFASNTSYYQLYYSPSDTPESWCLGYYGDMPLSEAGKNKWEWHENGDNYGKVTRILPNWFYVVEHY